MSLENKYFAELARRLRAAGITAGRPEKNRLTVLLNNQPVLSVSAGSDVFLLPAGSNQPEAGELYHKVAQTADEVYAYTRSGETALNRNVKYSNGMCIDEVTVGSLDAGVPGENAYYTGYHWTKSVCSRCGDWNSNETNGAPYAWDKNIYVLHDCAAKFYLDLPETVTHE